jgi:glucans biosynthesis protein C
MATQSLPRRHELDWLRVLAFALLVLYHTGMIFVPWKFHIKNAEIVPWLEYVMRFSAQWRLPLLFLIAGAGVGFSLRNRSAQEFRTERLRRLGVPILFGMLVIVPPQIYCERVFQGVYQYTWQSFGEFWLSVIRFKPYPMGGSFSWHHLWFVVYILVYSLLSSRLFVWYKSEHGTILRERIERSMQNVWFVAGLCLPLCCAAWCLGPFWDTTHGLMNDWYNFTVSLLIFIYGFLFAVHSSVFRLITIHRYYWFTGMIVATTILYSIYWLDAEWMNVSHAWFSVMPYWFLKYFNIYMILLTLIGFSGHYLTTTNRFLRYTNEAVYPFYILHQSVMIVIGFFIIPLTIGWVVKFIIIAIGTYAITMLLYEGIRHVRVLRFLFGLR